jgi:hypothetical protein
MKKMGRTGPVVVAAIAAAVAVLGALIPVASSGHGASRGARSGAAAFITESALLEGLANGAVFPFIDTTPKSIARAHIAITDATEDCEAGAAPPSNVEVLVGQAGVALTPVMTAGTNTGITTTPGQCVFHVTVRPGKAGAPETVTDIVVLNKSASPLTGINTVTASATVR